VYKRQEYDPADVDAAPTQISGLVANVTKGPISITWTAQDDVTSYTIYMHTSTGVSSSTYTSKVEGIHYTDHLWRGLDIGSTYYFMVQAENNKGISIASSEVSASPLMEIPTNFIGSNIPYKENAALSWNPVPGASSYKVYGHSATGVSSSVYTSFQTVTDPTYNWSGLPADFPFYFVVTALNGVGTESTISNEVTVTPADLDRFTKTPMPTGRTHLTSSVVNGKIYAIGGLGGLTTVEEYNPATNTWSTKAYMPTPRYSLTSSVVNGKIYAIGGYSGGYKTAVEEYNPATDTWATKASMPTARDGLTSSVVNGKIYVIGGFDANGYNSTVEEYDPVMNSWATKASMPTARDGLTSSVVNGKIYAIGGRNGTTTVEEYNPATDTWSSKVSMPTARDSLTTSVVNGKIYAIGGYDSGYKSTIEEYNPASNAWASKTAMLTARYAITSSVVNGKIYVIGGSNNSGNSSLVEEYTLIPVAAVPSTPTSPTATAASGKVTFSWSPVSDATSYTVYMRNASPVTTSSYTFKYTDVIDTQYLYTTVLPGNTYYFVVEAVNNKGASSLSSEVSATP